MGLDLVLVTLLGVVLFGVAWLFVFAAERM